MKTFKQILKEGINDPSIFKAVFLAGGPGSGKSFIVGKTALPALGFKVINSDEAFERALAKAGMKASPENIYSPEGQKIRSGAKALTKKKMDLALAGRLGLVIDGTGKDLEKIMKQSIALRKLGYDTAMIFVNTDEQTALKRNQMRSRSLPDETVSKMWKDVQKNIGSFQTFFGTSMFVVDNSEGSDVNSQSTNIYRKLSTWSKRTPKNKAVSDWKKSQRPVNEQTTIGGVQMKKLGSRPGSYKAYVAKHLGDKAADKIDKSDGNKLVAKGKKTGNQQMVRKGSFIKNVIAKEETQLDESLQIEKGAGIGTFLTAADMGMKTFGGFSYHPSVDPDLEEEHGAGEEGTDKLTKKYKKDTPGQ